MIMKPLLFLSVILACSSSGSNQTTVGGDARRQSLTVELRKDRARLEPAQEQSDLIRIEIDDQLKSRFPSLPRTQLDQLADQLNSRLRVAGSPQQQNETLVRLTDLRNYILSLNPDAKPTRELFMRNISTRLNLLNARI